MTDSAELKQLGDAIKAASSAVEDCFAALDSVPVFPYDDRAAICDDLDEAAGCLASALKFACTEAPP
jgi:hypothetical protein